MSTKKRIDSSFIQMCYVPSVLVIAGMAAAAQADITSYSTNFDSMTPGQSIAGQEGWYNTSGYPYDEQVTAGVGLGGTQAWMISNASSDGSVCTISTPNFAQVGESNTVYGGTPAYNNFTEQFWFRTVSSTDDPGLYISNSLGTAASVRNTWVGIEEDGGNLYAEAYGTDAAGNFTENPTTPALTWGSWYEVKVNATFVNGPDNDIVNYQVLDSNGNTLMNSTIGSWETYYATDPTAEQYPGPVASNRVTWGLAASPGVQGIYVDDLSLAVADVSVPEPASVGLLCLGGSAFLMRRRRASNG